MRNRRGRARPVPAAGASPTPSRRCPTGARAAAALRRSDAHGRDRARPRRRATCPGPGGDPSSAWRSWFAWNVRGRPATRTGNMFSTATATPVRRSTWGARPRATAGTRPAIGTADGRRPRGCRRWSPPRPNGRSSRSDRSPTPSASTGGRGVQRADLETELGERPDPGGVLALGVLRDHHLDAAVAGLGREPERPGEGSREERPTRTAPTGKPSDRCYRLIAGGRCVS